MTLRKKCLNGYIILGKNEQASRSLHIQPTACVATPHTLPMNYAKLQNQRVGCVRYARTRLLD